MKALLLLFMMLFTLYGSECPTSSWGSTTKCKVSVDDVSVEEGDSGTKTLTFTVSVDADETSKDIKIDFETADDTATANDDYVGDSDTVTILDGDKSATVSITINGDTDYEDNETFKINLTVNDDSTDDADIDDGEGVGTIENDDQENDKVSVQAVSVSESDGTINVTLVAKGGASKDLDIKWELNDDTADSDDYEDDSGTVHFDEGDEEKTISVTIKDDDNPEDEEKFEVTLSTDTANTDVESGYVTIKESDRIIITGESTASPEIREDKSPMKIYVRLVDSGETALNDIKLKLKSSEDTATNGDDYDDIDDTLTIYSGDNSVDTEVTVKDDEEEEDNEKFNLDLTCEECGNVELKEDSDHGTIIDDDTAETLDNGEYNDVDNYYLRDDSGDKKYKRLFCTPLNIWDNDGEVRVETDEANITQILDGGKSYYRLYAKNINVTDGDGKICKEGTKECETETLTRLGDNMDVNESWFTKDSDYVETDLPACEDGKATIYNVDEDGNQIWYNGGEYSDCNVSFKIRDDNYSAPFLFDETFKWYGDDTILNLEGGAYFFKKIQADGAVLIHIDENSDNPHNIARWYIQHSSHGGDSGYIFEEDSIINYEDCDGDGDLDDDDMPCQKPSKFMYWISADADMNDVIQNGVRISVFAYNAVGDRGDGASDASFTFDKDSPNVKNFVGALSGYRIDIDPDANTRIYWKKPDPDMKVFLGDGDRCIYTPLVYMKSKDKVFKESDAGDADLNVTIEYFTDSSLKEICRNDWNISFHYDVIQRYTDDADKEGNATKEDDYKMDEYSDDVTISRKCSDCDDSSCWADKQRSLGNFDIIDDNEIEGAELFDFNLSDAENAKFENASDDVISYLMRIVSGREFEDKDNDKIKSGTNKDKYKMLFCMPVNTWNEDGSMVEFYSEDDANVTQTVIDDETDNNFTYYHLYTNQIKNDADENEKVISCGSNGTEPCMEQTLRDGDRMHVDTSWFDENNTGEYVTKDLPECVGASEDERAEVTLYNVDENGVQIVYKEREHAFKNCVAKFKVRDANYTMPFLFKGVEADDSTAMIFDYGRYYFSHFGAYNDSDKIQEIYINDDRIKGKKIGGVDISWDAKEPDYKITRLYIDWISYTGTNHFFFTGGHYNYLDCNDDGELDEDDIDCQEPSKFMVWASGKYDGDNRDCPSDEEDDMCTFVIKDETMTAGYLYVNSPFLGSDNKFVNKNINVDDHGDYVYFSGGINSFLVKFNNNGRTRHIHWKKPDPALKFFLGDSNKCIYIPRITIKDGEDKKRETEDEKDTISFDINYLTSHSREALCRQDETIEFKYKLIQRYSDSNDKDGNATQDADYKADNYEKDVSLSRSCDDCSDSSCLHPAEYIIGDDGNSLDIVYDKEEEGDELFDINMSDARNIELEIPYDDVYKYVITILNRNPPQTITGFFDSYDIFRGDTNDDGDIADDGEEKNISTKISAQDFNVTLGSFDPNDDTKLKTTDENITVKYMLVSCPESNTTDADSCKVLSDYEEFKSDEHAEEDVKFNETGAVRFAAIKFSICSEDNDSDGDGEDDEIVLHPYDECGDNTDCSDNQKCIRNILSTDKFAIRPDKFDLVMDKYQDLISAEKISLTVKAVKYNSSAKVDANYSLEDADSNLILSKYKAYKKDDSETTLEGTLSFGTAFDIEDAEGNTSLVFDDVGKITVRIEDRNFSSVDEDDTNESGRYIVGEVNNTYIPDHFSVENAGVKNNDDAVYTYLTDDINNTSATLSLKIVAKNKDGGTTKNFKDGYWENDVNVTFSTTDNSDTSDINESNFVKNELIEADLDFSDGEATIEHNNSVLSFNYERNNSKAINPFKVDGSHIVTVVKSQYSTDVVDGNSTMSDSATFIYPKVYAPRYKFTGNTGDAYIYVVDYCDGDECDKSLLPDGEDSEAINDPRWFVNTKHKAKYGKVNEVSEKRKDNVSVTSLDDEDPKTKASLELDSSIHKSYKTTMKIKASKWLIYNKYDEDKDYNEFNVEFYKGETSWAGTHNTDTTTIKSGASKYRERVMW